MSDSTPTLERLERAIHAVDGSWSDMEFEQLPPNCRAIFTKYARAALDASGNDELVEALKACRLELFWCQKQLAAHGQTGRPDDSVSRALKSADAAIARTQEHSRHD